MKKLITATSLSILMLSVLSCGDNSKKSAPSIKDNSSHVKADNSSADYSNVAPSKLLRQIQAHYDLDEYTVAKEKLTYLMKSYPDTLNGVNINSLKRKIDAELKKELDKKQEIANLERNTRLTSSLDKMKITNEGKFTIYKDKTSPKFDTKECFYAYIKKDAYGPKLFFKIRYIDTEWLNIEEYIVTINQLDQTISGDITKSETKGKKRFKVELLDKPITSSKDLKMISSIADGENVTALYVGPNAYKKRDISKQQLLAIRNVLDAYAYMNAEKSIKSKINITKK